MNQNSNETPQPGNRVPSQQSINNSTIQEFADNYNHYRLIVDSQDIQDAMKHRRANMIGKLYEEKASTDENHFCPCCRNFCYEKKFSISAPLEEYALVAPIIPIVFYFVFYCILLLFFNFIFYGIVGSLILSKNTVPFSCFLNSCECVVNLVAEQNCNFREAFANYYHSIFILVDVLCCIVFKYIFYFWLKSKN